MKYFILLFFILCSFSRANKITFENRYALVIGNNNYEHNSKDGMPNLLNSVNDAISISKKLEELNFETTLELDLTSKNINKVLNNFKNKIIPGSAVFFYFSGHGVQIDGINYLLLTDYRNPKIYTKKNIKNKIIKYSIKLNNIIKIFEEKNVKINIVILDACRQAPPQFKASGLASLNAPVNSLITFATSPGKVSYGLTIKDKNSLYTKYLNQFLKEKNIPIDQTLKVVHKKVYQFSKNISKKYHNPNFIQLPWISSSLIDDFYMNLGGPIHNIGNEVGDTTKWYSIKNTNNINKIKQYLNKYPNGIYSIQAKSLLSKIKKLNKIKTNQRKFTSIPKDKIIIQQDTKAIYTFNVNPKKAKELIASINFFNYLDNYIQKKENPLEEISAGIKKNNTFAKILLCALLTHDRYKLANTVNHHNINICQDPSIKKSALGKYLLGRSYFFGKNIKHNAKKGLKYIKNATKHNNVFAENFLGDLYFEGYEVKQNYNKAFKCYQKAAKQYYPPAENNLGIMYDEGYGNLHTNYFEAVEWYKKAAKANYAKAQINLARHMVSGQGISTDVKGTVYWVKQAVKQKNSRAILMLAKLYENGIGVPFDLKKAKSLYIKILKDTSDILAKQLAKKSLLHIKGSIK